MSRDFRLKNYFALSKLVCIPFLFLLICFTYLSSLVFKLSKKFPKSHCTLSMQNQLFKSIGKKHIQAKGVVQQAAFCQYLGGGPRIMSRDFRLQKMCCFIIPLFPESQILFIFSIARDSQDMIPLIFSIERDS